MKPAAILAVIILATGCTTHQNALKKPPVASAAFVATQSARLHIAKARVEIRKATVVSNVEAVAAANTALDSADKALEDAGTRIESMQKYTEQITAAKEMAEESRLKEENAKRFWRAWSIRLGVLSGILALWLFRRPILALCGVIPL